MSKHTGKALGSDRRVFLKGGVAAGGAATAAAVGAAVVTREGSDGPSTAPPAESNAKGYHVTPHVEAYYRLARF